jgi:hypothetical protein
MQEKYGGIWRPPVCRDLSPVTAHGRHHFENVMNFSFPVHASS